MIAQHTPGPWTTEDEGRITANGTSPEGLTAVATVHGGPIHLPWGASDEDVANACLIASSPELLAALKHAWAAYEPEYVSAMEDDRERDGMDEAFDEVRVAIAKAEGEGA